MITYLVVCAEVSENDRDAFDRWYAEEHLSDAKAAFGAVRAFRGWSDDSAHLAFYECTALAAARAAIKSDALTALIAEVDRVWQGHIVRTRRIVDIVQVLD